MPLQVHIDSVNDAVNAVIAFARRDWEDIANMTIMLKSLMVTFSPELQEEERSSIRRSLLEEAKTPEKVATIIIGNIKYVASAIEDVFIFGVELAS